MRILGIDPGSETTGWGVIEGDRRGYALVDCGIVCASPKQKFPARLLRIADALEEIIQRYKPDACAIEDGFLATNVKVTLKLGQVRGVAMLVAERAALEIHEYSPRLVKQTVVGHGNAEKFQVQQMVKTLLSLATAPEPNDVADALAVAICHFHHASSAARLGATQANAKLASSGLNRRLVRQSARRRVFR
ncbi:MAG TPA: crossover junction endodeoxyribonuclease RuvC [Pyrinomonadaceae bacterium]|jgi:crossover junction endodeoxyribonuclease RuvC|nr:crossover junction endodeoxyribonuclease RuvC [Pyrinomonadaceae bacterium]